MKERARSRGGSPAATPGFRHPRADLLALLNAERVNILLVDDQEAALSLMAEMLADLGENIVLAQTGKEALKLLQTQDFAVAVLDINMPDLTGFEVATRLRELERNQEMPIIFVTGLFMEQEEVERGYGLGAVDYLFKPFPVEALHSKVAAYAALFRHTRGLRAQFQATLPITETDRLLVVNDDLPTLVALFEALTPVADEVLTAVSGREALDLLGRTDIALVLLEAHMPDQDGFETARIIHQTPKFAYTPILFTTTEAEAPAALKRGYAMGALDFLLLPLPPALLQNRVRTLLRHFRQSRILEQQVQELERLQQDLAEARKEICALHKALGR